MNTNSIFEEATKNIGARLVSTNKFLSNLKSNWQEEIKLFQKDPFLIKKFDDVIVDFVESPVYNAVSILNKNNQPIIAIYDGVKYHLQSRWLEEVAQRAIFQGSSAQNLFRPVPLYVPHLPDILHTF